MAIEAIKLEAISFNNSLTFCTSAWLENYSEVKDNKAFTMDPSILFPIFYCTLSIDF